MTEADVRDLIANRVEVLESGLTLLKKEQYIPSEIGTRSFIDLYARDAEGHHVLIELKRTSAASREAIHEVYKYVEAVKSHLGVRDNEIRVIIAAMDWAELLVPYSRFLADTQLAVTGLCLEVDTTSMTVTAQPVVPLPVERGRMLAPWYQIYWYTNRDALEKGLESILASCRDKNISDYVTVVLQPPEPIPSEHQMQMRHTIRTLGTLAGYETQEAPEVPDPTYEYAVLFATQVLTKETYLELLGPDYEPVTEVHSDAELDDLLRELHEELLAREPSPFCEHTEIGYGAKLSKFLETYSCKIESIGRAGTFERNPLLTDAVIISELRGEDGVTGQRLKRVVALNNRAHTATLRHDVKRCLEDNEVWRNQIYRVLDEIESNHPNAELDISIFYPGTGVLTFYFAATREYGILYMPMYSITVRDPDPATAYFGYLQHDHHPATLRHILDKYYEGEVGHLVMALAWGGRESRDVDVLEDLGLVYSTFRVEITGDQRSFFVLKNDRWRACDPVDPFTAFVSCMEGNAQLVNELALKIEGRTNNGCVDFGFAQRFFESKMDLQQSEMKPQYFSGAPSQCDVCGCDLSDERYMIDGCIQGKAWACMCSECGYSFGGGIGLGVGQLYQRTDNGWLLVGGGGPQHGTPSS